MGSIIHATSLNARSKPLVDGERKGSRLGIILKGKTVSFGMRYALMYTKNRRFFIRR